MVIPARYHPGMAMTLRLTDDDEKILAELARAEGISRHEATGAREGGAGPVPACTHPLRRSPRASRPVTPVRYLSLEDLLTLVDDLQVGPVRDLGLLESAAHRPTTTLWGAEAYDGLDLKA